MKIKIKLIALFLAVSILPIFFINILIFSNFKLAITEQVLNNLDNIATIEEKRISELLEKDTIDIAIISVSRDYSGLGETGEALIAKRDENGDVVFLHEGRFGALPKINKDKTDSPIIQALLKNEGVFTNLVDYRNKHVLVVTRHIEKADLGMEVKIDKSEAFAPINNLRNSLLIVGFISLILITWISFFVSKSISDPIVKLTDVINEISRGKTDTEIDPKLKKLNDEIGDLASSFDRTIVSLKLAMKKMEKLEKEKPKTEEKGKSQEELK